MDTSSSTIKPPEPGPQLRPVEEAESVQTQNQEKTTFDDIPLPAPTTLASHSGPRILRSSRTTSRSNSQNSRASRSRGSRSTSHSLSRGASRVASRNVSPGVTAAPVSALVSGSNRTHNSTPSSSSSLSALTDLDELEVVVGAWPRIASADEDIGQGVNAEDYRDIEELPDLNLEVDSQSQEQSTSGIDLSSSSMDIEQLSSPGPIVIGEVETISSQGPVVITDVTPVAVRGSRSSKRRRIGQNSVYEIIDTSPTSIAGPSNPKPTSSPRKHRRFTPTSPDIEIISSTGPSSAHGPAVQEQTKPVIDSTEPLSAYMCPICFSPPTNATLTPCGHVCCGECLFTAVRASLQRAGLMAGPEHVARLVFPFL